MRAVLMLAVAAAALAQPAFEPGSLEGRVTTPEGQPVARATVRLSFSSVGPSQRYVEVTAADGTFAVESLPPGVYLANVDRQGYVTPKDPSNASGLMPIPVGPGQRVSIELKLARLASVSGVVTGPAGELVPGAIVRLMRYAFVNGNLHLSKDGEAQSDAQGQFRIADVRAGRYQLVAMPQVVDQVGQATELQSYYPGSADLRGASAIDVQLAPVENLRIRMNRGPKYSVRGALSGFEMNGIAHPAMWALRTGDLGPGESVQVRGDGQFEMKSVAPGEYTLAARFESPGAPVLHGRTTVRVGNASVTGVTIPLRAGLSLTGRASIEGVELNSFMAAINRGREAAPFSQGPQFVLYAADIMGTHRVPVTTGENGSLEATGLQPLKYTLLPTWPGGMYVKRVQLNGKDITHQAIDLTSETDAVLEVILSLKTARLDVTAPAALNPAPVEEAAVAGFVAPPKLVSSYSIWPVEPDRLLNTGGVVAGFGYRGDGAGLGARDLEPRDYYVAIWEEIPATFVMMPEFLARFNALAARVTLHEGETLTVAPKVISKEAVRAVLIEFP